MRVFGDLGLDPFWVASGLPFLSGVVGGRGPFGLGVAEEFWALLKEIHRI